jgi:hypothetical protein
LTSLYTVDNLNLFSDDRIMPFDINDPDPYRTAHPAQETYPNDALRNNAEGDDLDKEPSSASK